MPSSSRSRYGRISSPVDYHAALRDIAKSLVRLKRPERLLKMIVRFLTRELGLTHAAILVLDPEKSRYTIFDSKGIKKLPKGLLKFDLDHPLIRWFQIVDKETAADRSCISRDRIHTLLKNPQLFKNRPEIKTQLTGLKQGMDNFRADLAIPGHFKETLVGVLLLGEKLSRRLFTQTEIHFFQTLVHDAAIAVKTSENHEHLIQRNLELEIKKKELEDRLQEIERLRRKEHDTYFEIMKSLAQEVNAKDPYTFGHIRRVERLGLMTAKEMGLNLDEKGKAILSAGLLLHDVGKIGIPDRILTKPGSLDREEWKVMRSHVEKGVKILEPLTDFKEVAKIVGCHHENFDGSGYPNRLKGEEIPLEARIVSVVDAFHAIVSSRCYREGRPVSTAIEELRRSAWTQFDPKVVEAFIRAAKKHGILRHSS